MTNLPDDPIDPYESRLTRRVGAFAEQAVRPIDHAAVASTAAAGARRRSLAGRLFGSVSATARLGVVLAGALVAAAVIGVAINAGAGPSPTAVANGPEATPTSVPGAVDTCAAAALTGEIAGWEGAAGHRIATIQVRNAGSSACGLPELLRPALVDEDGHALIVGQKVSDAASVTLAAGDSASSMVDMSNYCGRAPTAALKLRLYLPSEASVELGASGSVTNPIDAPPCNGENAPSTIEMQPLRLVHST
jgi:hypothetical protein